MFIEAAFTNIHTPKDKAISSGESLSKRLKNYSNLMKGHLFQDHEEYAHFSSSKMEHTSMLWSV